MNAAREMVAGDIMLSDEDEAARRAVASIFADMRGRKFLRYLFTEDPELVGAYGYIDGAFDLEVQREIFAEWQLLVLREMLALSRPTPAA